MNTIANNLEITKMTRKISKGNKGSFNELRELIESKKYDIGIKENEDLAILFKNNINITPKTSQFEKECKSIIIDKETLDIIGSQYNPVIYNYNAINNINSLWWNKAVVYKCYEGTTFLVYNHKDKWYISTRKCLESEGKACSNEETMYELFMEAMEDRFTFDDLNKNYCYHFILVHHKLKKIIKYNNKNQKKLYCILVTRKGTLNEVNIAVDGALYVKKENFKSFDELLKQIDYINKKDITNNEISSEGYIIKYYKGELHKSPFTIYKLQTEINQTLTNMIDKHVNVDQMYLELFKENKLNEYIKFFTKFDKDVINRISNSARTLSTEILDLYHLTRNNKNPELYEDLPRIYKQILYQLHGMYIKRRRSDFKNGVDMSKKRAQSSAITKFDTLKHLKTIDTVDLIKLYYYRTKLKTEYKDDPRFKFIQNCSHSATQAYLMFGNVFST